MKKHSIWHDLPNGGAMRCEFRVPVEVADKGAWQLDENRILTDAKEVSGVKLTWMHLSRAERWQKTPFMAVLRPNGGWNWCIAKVVPAACDSCGVEVGVRWVCEVGSLYQLWFCKTCARPLPALNEAD